jgi:hypothetical protein
MILKFSIAGQLLFVGVGGDRVLSIAAPYTRFVFLRVDKFSDLRKFNSGELLALEQTQRIVRDLPGLEDVRFYVVSELAKLGAKFVGECSVDDYLVFQKSYVGGR